jgi:hypothetical protein
MAPLASAMIFDPRRGVFTAAVLADGRVLVAGGTDGDASLASTEDDDASFASPYLLTVR